MSLTVPTTKDLANYVQKVELDGVLYTLLFQYNTRADTWVISISDADENPLVSGIRLVGDHEMIYRFAMEGRPKGFMFAIDTTNNGLDPIRDTLGDESQLIYVPEVEL